MIKTYLFLIGAILCEVAGTMLLPISQNFTKMIPTVTLSMFYLLAFYLLTFVVNKLPIAIVYATWSGLGIFTIAILGYVFFKQNLSWQAIMGLFLIILGVVLVNSFTSKNHHSFAFLTKSSYFHDHYVFFLQIDGKTTIFKQ